MATAPQPTNPRVGRSSNRRIASRPTTTGPSVPISATVATLVAFTAEKNSSWWTPKAAPPPSTQPQLRPRGSRAPPRARSSAAAAPSTATPSHRRQRANTVPLTALACASTGPVL